MKNYITTKDTTRRYIALTQQGLDKCIMASKNSSILNSSLLTIDYAIMNDNISKKTRYYKVYFKSKRIDAIIYILSNINDYN